MAARDTLRQLYVTGVDDAPTLDWRELRFVTPTLMAGCAALAYRFGEQGRAMRLEAPSSPDVLGYMARMRFGQILGDLGVEHDVARTSRTRDRREDLLELSPITSEADAARLARLVEGNLRESDPEMASRLFRSLGEIGSNVADHARAVGYMAAQKMPSRKELCIAVADCGVGLLHWLAGARGAMSDSDALTMVLNGLSRHTDAVERGGGVARTHELVAQMSGRALLASGGAWSETRASTPKLGTTRYQFPGTLFEARIPLV